MVRPVRRASGWIAVAMVAGFLSGCFGTAEPPVRPPGIPDPVESRLTPESLSASEVSVAANPLDPLHAVAAANSEGGFGLYWTFDGGATWEADLLTAGDVGAVNGQARFVGLSDPAVAFGPDGAVYLAGLAYIPTSSVFVAVSRDGGKTWPDVHIVHESDLASSFNDKEWIGVSPVTGTLVASWQKEPALDTLREVDLATGADVDIGDIVVARSTDGGQTWTEPAKVSRGLHSNGTQIAFTSDGRAHLVWLNYEEPGLDYAFSADDGATWSSPAKISPVDTVPMFDRYARMHTLPGLAAHGDRLAATWHDNRNGDADVLAITSDDGGQTWSSGVRVNGDEVGNGVVQFYPWVAVAPDGTIHVSYYDATADPARPLFHYVVATMGPGDLAFGAPRAASTEPFPAFNARTPGPGGEDADAHGLGDYTGLAATSAGVIAAWADGRERETVVFASWLPPAPT